MVYFLVQKQAIMDVFTWCHYENFGQGHKREGRGAFFLAGVLILSSRGVTPLSTCASNLPSIFENLLLQPSNMIKFTIIFSTNGDIVCFTNLLPIYYAIGHKILPKSQFNRSHCLWCFIMTTGITLPRYS